MPNERKLGLPCGGESTLVPKAIRDARRLARKTQAHPSMSKSRDDLCPEELYTDTEVFSPFNPTLVVVLLRLLWLLSAPVVFFLALAQSLHLLHLHTTSIVYRGLKEFDGEKKHKPNIPCTPCVSHHLPGGAGGGTEGNKGVEG